MNLTTTNNYSTYSYDEVFSDRLATIQGAIYIPIFCAGIANNFLTILIISLNRDMRTVTNCYLLNLAISDTLPLLVSLPFEISFLPVEVPWGQFGCQLRALLAETSTNASILTISAFTIERYSAVCRPLRNAAASTTERAVKVQIFIWFIAILSSTPYFFLAKKIAQHCAFDQNYQLFVTICVHVSATCFFVLPACILCLLYALMAQRLYNVAILHQPPPMKDNNHLSGQGIRMIHHLSSPDLMSTRQLLDRNRTMSTPVLSLNVQTMKKSVFKMLFAVVIAFIICYAPFHVQRLITSRLDDYHLSLTQRRLITIFYFISGIFYYLGSTVNPIFYHLFSRKYRLAFSRTVGRLVHCKRQPRFRPNQHSPKKHRPCLLIARYSKQPHVTTKPVLTTHRSPRRIQANIDIRNKKTHLYRFSLPAFI